ncbi:MAG: phosphatidylinositol transfer protein [Myxococcales bacterium]|nr:phosphatidylinositol transfer protein [Myxococcales bacterium]
MRPGLLAPLVLSLLGACSGATGATSDVTDTGRPADTGTDTADDVADEGVDSGMPTDTSVADTPTETPPTECALRPTCDGAPPAPGAKRSWRHTTSSVTAALGSARHRGRDLFLLEGAQTWLLAKFAYGTADKDIKDEDVDVWLQRGCSGPWKKIGTFATTNDGAHATVEGVVDTGGRLFVDLAKTGEAPLGVGKHRVHFVVGGDLSTTDAFLEVVPKTARIAVTDMDGTLTTSEYAAWTDYVGLAPPDAHPGAADALTTLAKRGYYLFYLTARPEWLMDRTREWIPLRKFPPGLVHTTLTGLGATGASATTFKTDELALLKTATGITPSFAFGNKDTDVAAFVNGKVPASGCYYYDMAADAKGGTIHKDYAKLVPVFAALPAVCP